MIETFSGIIIFENINSPERYFHLNIFMLQKEINVMLQLRFCAALVRGYWVQKIIYVI